jgi:hypothetical protein
MGINETLVHAKGNCLCGKKREGKSAREIASFTDSVCTVCITLIRIHPALNESPESQNTNVKMSQQKFTEHNGIFNFLPSTTKTIALSFFYITCTVKKNNSSPWVFLFSINQFFCF